MVDVSVVVPCRNEEKYISGFLESLFDQQTEYTFEVIIADGMSLDKTRNIIGDFVKLKKLNVRIVDNPKQTISAGLNIAFQNSSGKFIVRLDVHSIIGKNYIQEITEKLESSYSIVGPNIRYLPSSSSETAQVVVAVLNSRFGNGGTPSRNNLFSPRKVYHAVMSCYRREVFSSVGGYNEQLLSNEDFDFDYRATVNNFEVFALPMPTYFAYARSTVSQFWKQRFRYGFWKAQVVKIHPKSIHFRQFIPPLFFILVFSTLVLIPQISLFLILVYIVMTLISFLGTKKSFIIIPLYFLVMFINHFSWTLGLICGIFYSKRVQK